jgi:hypothetical protein
MDNSNSIESLSLKQSEFYYIHTYKAYFTSEAMQLVSVCIHSITAGHMNWVTEKVKPNVSGLCEN